MAGASEVGTATIGAKSTTPALVGLATSVRYIIDLETEGVVSSSTCNRGCPNWGAAEALGDGISTSTSTTKPRKVLKVM